jgi:hypothetical protein
MTYNAFNEERNAREYFPECTNKTDEAALCAKKMVHCCGSITGKGKV